MGSTTVGVVVVVVVLLAMLSVLVLRPQDLAHATAACHSLLPTTLGGVPLSVDETGMVGGGAVRVLTAVRATVRVAVHVTADASGEGVLAARRRRASGGEGEGGRGRGMKEGSERSSGFLYSQPLRISIWPDLTTVVVTAARYVSE